MKEEAGGSRTIREYNLELTENKRKKRQCDVVKLYLPSASSKINVT